MSLSADGDISIVVTSEGGTSAIVLKSNNDWSIKPNSYITSSWCEVTPTKGKKGSFKLTVKTSPNDSFEERNASFTLSSDKLKRTIVITQKQKYSILLSSNKVEVGCEENDIEVLVSNDKDYSFKISPDCQNWIHFISTESSENVVVSFRIDENETTASREGAIIFHSDYGDEFVRVYQEKFGPKIIISDETIDIGYEGGIFRVETKSNVIVDYEIPSDLTWIHPVETKSWSSNTFYFEVDKNDTLEERIGKIIFTDKEGVYLEGLGIFQSPKGIIIPSDNKFVVNAESQYLRFLVSSNVDYSIRTDVSWIQHIKYDTKSLVDKELCFNIDRNESAAQREGKIIISNGEVSQTITVIQQKERKEAFLYSYLLPVGAKEIITECYFHTNSSKTTKTITNNPDYNGYPIYIDYSGTRVDLYTQAETIYTTAKFSGWSSLQHTDVSMLTPLDLNGFFAWCKSLKSVDLSGWDTSMIDDMSLLFAGCSSLESVNLSGLETAKVRSMAWMFQGCSSLKSLNLEGWDTSQVESMDLMFKDCSYLESLDLSGWDTSNTCNFGYMFSNCQSLKTLNLSGWDTSAATNMEFMISNCQSLKTLNLSGWDTSAATNMEFMISDCPSLENIELSGWVISDNYEKIGPLIDNCNSLHELTLRDWSRVPSTLNFIIPSALYRLDLRGWKTINAGMIDPWVAYGKSGELFIDDATIEGYITGNKNNRVVAANMENTTIHCKSSARNYILQRVYYAKGKPTFIITDNDEEMYQSTDYSMDGRVVTLQKASEGNGIDIVLMGNLYTDKDIKDGLYDSVMVATMNTLFSIEPLSSHKEYFNVYEVYAVSKTNYPNEESALGVLPHQINDYTYYIKSDNSITRNRIEQAIDGISWANCTAIVIENFNIHSGLASGAIVYASPRGDRTIPHEFGHAFGKLADEYSSNGSLTYLGLGPIWEQHKIDNVYANVDIVSSPSEIKWSRFIFDSRYEPEGIGVFEGGLEKYIHGIWRPTKLSLMGGAGNEFNAPSRESLYKRIHKLAYGPSWEYDYETFVQQDLKNIKPHDIGLEDTPAICEPLVNDYITMP